MGLTLQQDFDRLTRRAPYFGNTFYKKHDVAQAENTVAMTETSLAAHYLLGRCQCFNIGWTGKKCRNHFSSGGGPSSTVRSHSGRAAITAAQPRHRASKIHRRAYICFSG